MATVKAVVRDSLSVKNLKDVACIMGGIFSAVLGEAVVVQRFGKTSPGARLAGNVGGSLVVGATVGVLTKNVRNGVKVALGGISYTIAKTVYEKVLANRTILGMTMPATMLGDWVEMPPALGMGDFVEIPEGTAQFEYEEPEGAPFGTTMGGEEDIEF